MASPKISHLILNTANYEAMKQWYLDVFEATIGVETSDHSAYFQETQLTGPAPDNAGQGLGHLPSHRSLARHRRRGQQLREHPDPDLGERRAPPGRLRQGNDDQ